MNLGTLTGVQISNLLHFRSATLPQKLDPSHQYPFHLARQPSPLRGHGFLGTQLKIGRPGGSRTLNFTAFETAAYSVPPLAYGVSDGNCTRIGSGSQPEALLFKLRTLYKLKLQILKVGDGNISLPRPP